MTANTRTQFRSFARGEITPEMFGRMDLVAYQTGLRTCRNFETLPHGPAQTRAGFGYVIEVKHSSAATRLIPFAYNTSQTYQIELGNLYARFHTNGGTVLEASKVVSGIVANTVTVTGHGYTAGKWVYIGSRYYVIASTPTADTFTVTNLDGTAGAPSGSTAAQVFEIATPYVTADLFALTFAQSADVLTLTHPSYAPRELRRLSASSFALSTITFAPATGTPVASSTAGQATGPLETILGITQANPGVVNSAAHGFRVGEFVQIDDVVGMSELNARCFRVNTVPNGDLLTLADIDTGVPIDTTAYGAYSSGGKLFGPTLYRYKCTAVAEMTLEEGLPSDEVRVCNDLTVANAKNDVPFGTLLGMVRYRIYRATNNNDIYGFAGEIAAGDFTDNNISPDFSTTPPESYNPFNAAGDYPSAVSYFEQRRVFANTDNNPQSYWFTRSGTESNMTYSIPTRDDDSISGRLVARQVNEIRHVVPFYDLLMLTSGGAWRVSPANSDVLTPSTISPRLQTNVGAAQVTPWVTASSVLYVQDGGGRVVELTPSGSDSNGRAAYAANDASLFAPHLFDGYTLVDTAYCIKPVPTLWCVRSDGVLLGLTYVPQQEVLGWHQHDTDGAFESVCVSAEGTEDVLYAIVRRTVDGRTVRYIERKHSRRFDALEDWFGVDAGVTYDGAAATTITNLHHLEGATVSILADGAVQPQQVVTGGEITLEQAASLVHVGLPYTCDLETLPLTLEADALGGRGRVKNVGKVYLRVYRSSGVYVGPDEDHLKAYLQRTTEAWGVPPALKSEEITVPISSTWSADGAVLVRQTDPLPLTVLSMALEVAVGG